MIYRWTFNSTPPDDQIDALVNRFKISPLLAQLFYERHLESQEDIDAYINPSLDQLHDPFLMKNMDLAVDRLIHALREGENILVYGDYDVDGTTGVSLLYEGLFKLGGKVSYYIPNRMTEGYGLARIGIEEAYKRKTKLILTVDCGITAIDEVELARGLGMDVIVSDHHEPGSSVPNANAVINPKQADCNYPFKELAGVGVGFKLMQALYTKLGYTVNDLEPLFDLVATGTAADIVQLVDENRILVKYGLERLNKNPRHGLFALLESSSLLGKEINVSLIVFVLAPRINSVGRMSSAKKAVHLLTSTSMQNARNIARILESENKMRRGVDDITCQEAIKMIEETYDIEDAKILVLAQQDWHPGVIGIVASRVMEKYNRPAILISLQDGIGKGSARSTINFDIYSALNSVSDLLENFGGHKFAAGLTIKEENVAKLRKKLATISEEEIETDDFFPTLDIVSETRLSDFDATMLRWLKNFAPYGPQNMTPVFVARNLNVVGDPMVVGNNHLKLKVKQDGIVIDAIAYNFGDQRIKFKPRTQRIDAAFVMEENTWHGQTTVQMRIKDFNLID